MVAPIILYDIDSRLDNKAWAPNPQKTRYALHVKGLLFKTKWVEYPDIEVLAKKIGAPPTGTKHDGTPHYTVPIIHDPNTGKIIADSFVIAEYLDATYPGKALFPAGTKPLMASFESSVLNAYKAIDLLQLGLTYPILNPASQPFFIWIKEGMYGCGRKLAEFSPEGPVRDADLAKAKAAFGVLDGWLAKNEGKFVLGDTVSYADCILAGWVVWIKTTEVAWKEVATWHNGRWATHLDDMEKAGYAAIN